MRRLLFSIAISALLGSSTFAQVDTLQLVEIGSIEAPGEIVELYVEDLDGDSQKEIVLTTATNVHIYNGITYDEIWSSPELDHPRDLLFADINLDGFTDFSVKDTTNIRLFDPHNDATIWSSPEIDSTYECYTIGDRNDDYWIDVAIVSKEWFTRRWNPNNRDTVWVDIFDGPSFAENDGFTLMMKNNIIMGDEGFYQDSFEAPNVIAVEEITGQDGTLPRISIFTDTSAFFTFQMRYTNTEVSGKVWLVNAINYEIELEVENGFLLHESFIESDGAVYLHCVSGSYSHSSSPNGHLYDHTKMINSLSADSLFSGSVIWESADSTDSAWNGFIVNDVNYEHAGYEICYSSNDSLYLSGFPEEYPLWYSSGIYNIAQVSLDFKSISIFNDPQIICQIGDPPTEYQFFNGSDGSLTAVLAAFGYLLSDVSDLDSDGNDEIMSIADNMLYIYGLQRTAIDEDPITPNRHYLSANYPNPFNSSTTIEYGLPVRGHVMVEIYDLLGRRVDTLVDSEQEAGRYQVTWDAANRSSGVYFYRIRAGDYEDTRRMALLK
jgi:hypothetical protein